MPADFEKCQAEGGKIITHTIDKNRYIHVCYDKDGKSHPGEVRTKKSSTEKISEGLKQKKSE